MVPIHKKNQDSIIFETDSLYVVDGVTPSMLSVKNVLGVEGDVAYAASPFFFPYLERRLYDHRTMFPKQNPKVAKFLLQSPMMKRYKSSLSLERERV